jgi:hypothetical protein
MDKGARSLDGQVPSLGKAREYGCQTWNRYEIRIIIKLTMGTMKIH